MAFLRFTRDKRGYETTALFHESRQDGRTTQRLLYWFRTPPNVTVGRSALDQDAMRWVEDANPGIAFNWQDILGAQPPSIAVSVPNPKDRRRRDTGRQRRPASPSPEAKSGRRKPLDDDAPRGEADAHQPDLPPVEIPPDGGSGADQDID